jgi:hypothetical protein
MSYKSIGSLQCLVLLIGARVQDAISNGKRQAQPSLGHNSHSSCSCFVLVGVVKAKDKIQRNEVV